MNRRVDQKLHSAKLLLASLNTTCFPEKNPAFETALVESALFHLHIAYRAYLRELLSHCKIATDTDTAQQAASLLRAQQLQSSDVDELAEMERSGAWPAQLCKAYAGAISCVDSVEPVAKNSIALRDVTADIDGEIIAAWLEKFRALILRQREHASEW